MRPHRRHLLTALPSLAALAITPTMAKTKKAAPSPQSVEQWGLYEITLKGPATGNPFTDATIGAEFTCGSQLIFAPGFYDGDGIYKVRFSPPDQGAWRWESRSNIPELNGQTGSFNAIAPSAANHGPIRVTGGYHFDHADGAPFRQIGTTCYSWAQQSDARCRETLATLKASPFNKLRMLVFANVGAEPLQPYVTTGEGPRDYDRTRFNPAYFQRFEARVASLMALGIEADIILFHPYDAKRGYSDMARADDERYLAYIIARLSAYRNVWWSLANEYDLIKTKSPEDIDHLLAFLKANDPHRRLRSIHNIKVLYDNGKPWITHSSIQNGSAVLDDRTAETYRSVWKKPVIFDEVCYEGDIDQRWGNLTAEQMVMRFWHAHIAGTYCGHSETFTPDHGGADGSWLGKGGKLYGQSAPRLAFMKRIMEDGPAPGIDPIDKWWEQHMGGREGQYYLRYFGTESPDKWSLDLPKNGLSGGEVFRVDVIDTWNMTIETLPGTFKMSKKNAYYFNDPTRPEIVLPQRPWMMVRLLRQT